MPSEVEDTESVCDPVATQDLEGYDERVLHEIAVDCAVEDMDGTVVGRRGEQGIGGVVSDGPERLGVVSRRVSTDLRCECSNAPQSFVWLGAEVKVEPTQLLIVTANDQIVTERVNIHA